MVIPNVGEVVSEQQALFVGKEGSFFQMKRSSKHGIERAQMRPEEGQVKKEALLGLIRVVLIVLFSLICFFSSSRLPPLPLPLLLLLPSICNLGVVRVHHSLVLFQLLLEKLLLPIPVGSSSTYKVAVAIVVSSRCGKAVQPRSPHHRQGCF